MKITESLRSWKRSYAKEASDMTKAKTFFAGGTNQKVPSPLLRPTKSYAITLLPLTQFGAKSGVSDPGPKSPTSYGWLVIKESSHGTNLGAETFMVPPFVIIAITMRKLSNTSWTPAP